MDFIFKIAQMPDSIDISESEDFTCVTAWFSLVFNYIKFESIKKSMKVKPNHYNGRFENVKRAGVDE